MVNEIKAIETRYKGYRFRSRLEARWAVFFDALGVKWEYEKEGYQLPSGWYLPDFWLSQVKMWAEVKGNKFSCREMRLAEELVDATGFRVLILDGPIEPRCYWGIGKIDRDGCRDSWDYDIAEGHEYWKSESRFYCHCGEDCDIDNPNRYEDVSPLWKKAVTAARSARFEHGEQP